MKPGKTYYVRIRTIAKVKGRKYYSAWSKVETVKTLRDKSNADAQAVEPVVGDESLDLVEDLSLSGIDTVIDGGIIDGIDMEDREIELTME